MEQLTQFIDWLVDGFQRFFPGLPTPASLWRFLYEHVGNVPLVAAFVAMLYFALGIASRAARSGDIRAFGKLILSIGLAVSVLLVGYFALRASSTTAPAQVPDKAHYEEMARRLGTQVSVPATTSFAEALADQLARHYFFLLPCVVMVVVGALILVLFRPGGRGASSRS